MKTAIVLASGPSLTAEQIDAARRSGHHTIVVNSTFRNMLDATTLYAGDFLWWKVHVAEVKATFKGKLWTQDNSVHARWPGINRMKGSTRDGLGMKVIHTNGNSGMQALNLAFLWGFERIVLLGFDMKNGPNGEKHHHPDHPAPMVQGQCFDEWLLKAGRVAKDIKATNCEVLNCTPGSAMTCFPIADWREVLA